MKKKLILSCIVGFLLCLLSVIPIYASECSHVWETVYRIEPDCLSKGSEMKICQKCRKIETISLPVSDHPWGEWQITTAPNCTYTGIKTRTCTFCYKTQQEDVPTNGIHSWSDWKTATNICTEEKKPIDPVHIVILKKLPSSQLLIMYGENGTLIKSRLYLKLVCVCVIA